MAVMALFAVARAGDYSSWSWSADLPQGVDVSTASTNRTSAAVDRLFKDRPDKTKQPQLALILAGLGRPEAFSRQQMYSRTQGTSQPSRNGGTLRFLLSDGGEVHVMTYDFTTVGFAVRWDVKGKGKLLYK